jgi:hypothetical protein
MYIPARPPSKVPVIHKQLAPQIPSIWYRATPEPVRYQPGVVATTNQPTLTSSLVQPTVLFSFPFSSRASPFSFPPSYQKVPLPMRQATQPSSNMPSKKYTEETTPTGRQIQSQPVVMKQRIEKGKPDAKAAQKQREWRGGLFRVPRPRSSRARKNPPHPQPTQPKDIASRAEQNGNANERSPKSQSNPSNQVKPKPSQPAKPRRKPAFSLSLSKATNPFPAPATTTTTTTTTQSHA